MSADQPHMNGAPDLCDQLAQRFSRSDFAVLEGRYWDDVLPCIRRMYPNQAIPVAVKRILNHAANDFTALIYETQTGQGRPAARTARALIEHLINMETVYASPQEAEKYLAHQSVTNEIIATIRPGLDYLETIDPTAAKKAKRSYAHALRKSTRAVSAAVAKYHKSFRRTWTATSLYDRAVKFQRAGEYEYYRVLSGVLHGSSGGLIGTLGKVENQVMHRTGPDLQLVPVAWLAGSRAWRSILLVLQNYNADDHLDQLLMTMREFIDSWPFINATMIELDKATWPTKAINLTATLLVLKRHPTKSTSISYWYYYDSELGVVIPANPPADPEAAVDDARNFVHRNQNYSAQDRDEFENGRPLTMPDVKVYPRPGAKPQPYSSLLPPPPPVQPPPALRGSAPRGRI